tara:strand:+ start:772 stop:1239 length:468 start_codon:yes stop_codon:yes gene_type:complete
MEKYVDEEKQEFNNNTELNLGQIRSMLDEIESMSIEEHQNIIKILGDNNVKSMENDNGLFVKMNQLSIEVIKSIYEYVAEVRESKKNLETAIQSMEPVRHNINKNLPEDVSENPINDVNIDVEDWKLEIIQKMRTESKVRSKKRKQTSKANTTNP